MMTKDAFETYKTYVALKRHFTTDTYDYFRYYGKTRVSVDSFLKRKDRILFAKLAKEKSQYLVEFLVSAFIVSPNVWVGELLSEGAEQNYKEWKKRQESLTYQFKTEIDFLRDYDTPELFQQFFSAPTDGSHPKPFTMLMKGELALETYIILDMILTFTKRYDKIYSDPLYKEKQRLCKKYQPFLEVNLQKMKAHLRQTLGM